MRKFYHYCLSLLGALLLFAFSPSLHAQGFPNSIRISMQGADGATNIDALDPAVAYNATDDEFMVVWSGDTLPSEDEIWGQRVSASSGALLGSVIRVSDMGPTGSATFDAFAPAIAWNSTDNEYLVVWSGDDDQNGLINAENEIFGQRLSNTGSAVGNDDFRISFVGGTGAGAFDAFDTDVAYNSTDNQYMVVWSGDSIDGEDEIQGQLIAANGNAVGSQVTISNQGPSGSALWDAEEPAIAYNATNNEFMVIWWGDFQQPGEHECFARRLSGSTGMPLDTARAISDMGPAGDTNIDVATGDVAWNSTLNQYLVVFDSDDVSAVTANGENEIFGQLLDNNGQEIGPNDFVISSLGTNLSGTSDAFDPHVIYSPNCMEYVVSYEGDNVNGSTVNGEVDVFIARVDPMGTPTGIDSAISNAGIIGNDNFDTGNADLAFSTQSNTYLVVNHGEDDAGMLVDGENEIYGLLKGCCSAPAFSGMASTDTVCPGTNTVLTTNFTGNTDSLRWECSVNGGPWLFVSNGANYSGTTTGTLTILGTPPSVNGNQYRLVGYACGMFSMSPPISVAVDPSAPSITCPADITETPNTFDCNPSISWVPPTAVDNCAGASAMGSSNPNDNFPVGTTTVTYTATDATGNTATCTFDITVNQPVISGGLTYIGGDLCATVNGTYQWSMGGTPVSGATNMCFVPTSPGTYSVEVTDMNGCTATFDTTLTVVGRVDGFANAPTIFPNPTNGELQMRFPTLPLGRVTLVLTDLSGKQLLSQHMEGSTSMQLDLSDRVDGIYLLHITTTEGRIVKKIQLAR